MIRPLPLLLPAVLLVVAPLSAYAVDSLVTGKACSPRELYLEDTLAPKPDPAYCADCKRDTAEQFFGIDDLASDTQKAAADPISIQPPLPVQCFSAVMSMRPSGPSYHYAGCTSAESSTHGRHVLPCASSNLAGTIQTALQQTMNCLGVNEKEVFSLFGWDSHFQINLWNSGGVGAGQLTSIAVADIDINRRFAGDLSKPACQQFEGIFAESAESYRKLSKEDGHYPRIKPCEWMAPPENPAKNLLYAGATYRMDKDEAEILGQEIGSTPADAEKIATTLARYMYNGGLGGVRNVFRLFRLRTQDQSMTYKEFAKAFSRYLGTYYEGDAADEATKARVAAYAHHVSALQKDVEKITGDDACSE